MMPLVQIQRAPVYDCQKCGACCSFYLRHVDGVDADTPELIADPDLTHFVENDVKFTWPDGDVDTYHMEGHVMRAKVVNGQPVCVALAGQVGQSCACTVYEHRPTACRNFTAGSPACLYGRRWAGLEDPPKA